ncbi:hypothetical protein Agabi119p4_7350 [Agaricus bisporus var. burnettii]|uniref:U6 snRNA phosphodiesterase n=1 Tax=Agaricus bisporus var. burnettii TaxID=192524 RepID=A0A8H7C7F8_AGABI|nr:hypothetical protein Agabi119p4_7350 [Agaricus bisporus var. burnettii]
MKRHANAIVDYDSSSDETAQVDIPPPKKKKLPVLSPNLVLPAPIDDPSLHQGRTRSTPHTDGNWAAHVYVSITITKSHTLYSLLETAVAEAKRAVPTLNSFTSGQTDRKHQLELHISLTRPFFIRAHQKEEFRQAIRKLAKCSPFALSFTSFAELHNDEHTRTFLVMEIGAGHHELNRLCCDLKPLIESLRQRAYYARPRFHASVAWALLDHCLAPVGSDPTIGDAPSGSVSLFNREQFTPRYPSKTEIPANFVTIPGLPEGLIAQMNHRFKDQLSSPLIGSFDAENVVVKIGKETYSWPFIGTRSTHTRFSVNQ